ncbi:MAG: hypothetical protein Ct9H300mP22_6090 [Gammaproteobacteria bacterium]|nr:MAG: hypothetical protein Ct9H300mP22_6090 [Gammaproteobacteria bacterium]
MKRDKTQEGSGKAARASISTCWRETTCRHYFSGVNLHIFHGKGTQIFAGLSQANGR